MKHLPDRFCWTRFGTESGESIESILSRKERERQSSGGVFMWGIGNSVGPAIRELVRVEKSPRVVFSPMLSRAKSIDVSPAQLFAWTRATTLDQQNWVIPRGINVVSRAATSSGDIKQVHYALVCRSETPLQILESNAELFFDDLSNLLSQNKLGHSQVTSVVHHRPGSKATGAAYSIGFAAELVYPYFVQLRDPQPLGANASLPSKTRLQSLQRQESLLNA